MSNFSPCICFDADVEELEGQMQKLLEKQNFIAFWDPEIMLPPHTDVILEATDGRYVHAHRATLVHTHTYNTCTSVVFIYITLVKVPCIHLAIISTHTTSHT